MEENKIMKNESIYYVLRKTYFVNEVINQNHKTFAEVFFKASKVGTYMLGRKIDDYIIIKQNNNESRVFTSTERDVFKLEKALQEF